MSSAPFHTQTFCSKCVLLLLLLFLLEMMFAVDSPHKRFVCVDLMCTCFYFYFYFFFFSDSLSPSCLVLCATIARYAQWQHDNTNTKIPTRAQPHSIYAAHMVHALTCVPLRSQRKTKNNVQWMCECVRSFVCYCFRCITLFRPEILRFYSIVYVVFWSFPSEFSFPILLLLLLSSILFCVAWPKRVYVCVHVSH